MLPDERTIPSGEHPVRAEEDLLAARHAVRAAAVAAGFTIVDQTKIVTAASELVRNAYIHGGGGTMTVGAVRDPAGRLGLRLRVRDEGPGLPAGPFSLRVLGQRYRPVWLSPSRSAATAWMSRSRMST